MPWNRAQVRLLSLTQRCRTLSAVSIKSQLSPLVPCIDPLVTRKGLISLCHSRRWPWQLSLTFRFGTMLWPGLQRDNEREQKREGCDGEEIERERGKERDLVKRPPSIRRILEPFQRQRWGNLSETAAQRHPRSLRGQGFQL